MWDKVVEGRASRPSNAATNHMITQSSTNDFKSGQCLIPLLGDEVEIFPVPDLTDEPFQLLFPNHVDAQLPSLVEL